MSNILPLSVGSAVVDTLGEAGDVYIAQEGYYYDYYKLTNLAPGVPVTINMNSSNMNTWVGVYNGDTGEWVTWDDDSGSGVLGTDSKLTFTPKLGDTYYIAASSSATNSTGTYILSVV